MRCRAVVLFSRTRRRKGRRRYRRRRRRRRRSYPHHAHTPQFMAGLCRFWPTDGKTTTAAVVSEEGRVCVCVAMPPFAESFYYFYKFQSENVYTVHKIYTNRSFAGPLYHGQQTFSRHELINQPLRFLRRYIRARWFVVRLAVAPVTLTQYYWHRLGTAMTATIHVFGSGEIGLTSIL